MEWDYTYSIEKHLQTTHEWKSLSGRYGYGNYWLIIHDTRNEKPWIVIHQVGWEIRNKAATLEEAKSFVEGQEK